MLKGIVSLALLSAASAYGVPPCDQKSNVAFSQFWMPTDRRTALAGIAALTSAPLLTPPAQAADATPPPPPPPSSLAARVADNSLAPPPYGMETPDIFYPPAFRGSWRAVSRTVDVAAPCGVELFAGGRAGYDRAVQSEITERHDLEYRARFVAPPGGGDDAAGGGDRLVADREYNAREMAKAAMGEYSVVDTPLATPNRYSCLLAPPGGGSDLLCVDIVAIARKAEPATSPDAFACSEFVRQIVSPSRRNNPNAAPVSPLSVKEIETISIYTVVGEDTITCRQRTASFLVPSQTDPIALKKWQMSQGRPVDVRYYDVTYTRA